MISVVIPLYNKEKYIKNTVESVLKQSFQEFELIIVNDGSTDNSLDVVKSIIDDRIRIIDKSNEGVSSARNRGVEEAGFSYIAFLDGDDLWDKNFLEEMKDIILCYSGDKVFACNFSFLKKGHHCKSKVRVNIPKGDSSYLDYFTSFNEAKYSPICSSAIVIHRSVFEHYQFHQSLTLGEDLFLWMQLALEYKIVYCNKDLVSYNHDIETSRAIGCLHSKETNFLFFLDEFNESENINIEMKKMLDYLRIAYMKPYLLKYPNEVRAEINKVNKANMDFQHYIYYNLPRLIVRLLYKNINI